MEQQPQLPSDGQLIVAARDGMNEAWNELVRRHGAALNGVAKARHRSRSKKLAQQTLDQLHASIVSGEAASDGQPAERAVRTRAIALLTGGMYGPGAEIDVDAAGTDGSELQSLARAFSTLPEPWQTALWHRAVELQPAAEYAPLLGRTANEAAAVVQRAEAGLFEGFLLDQTGTQGGDADPECAPIVPLLGGSLRTTLSAHQQRLVDDHVDNRPNDDGEPGCAACRRRLKVNDEIPTLLPTAIVPGLTGMSVGRYRAAVGVRPQPAGTAAVVEKRLDRFRKFAFFGAFAALLLAFAAAVVLVRNPFDSDTVPSTSASPSTIDATDPTTSVVTTQTTEPGAESTTTTTEIALRPPITGPANRIELVFADGERPIGFAPTPSDLTVGFSSPAPIFAGGTGTIDVAIANEGDAQSVANFTIQVPRGVLFDGVISGAADCTDPVGDSAFCNVTIEARDTSTLALRFSLESSTVGRFILESQIAEEPLEVQIHAVSRLVHSSVDQGDIVMVGNTLMSCDETDAVCLDARDGIGDVVNRWDVATQFIGANNTLGFENSSEATIEIGGATIDRAYLFWSGDLNERQVSIPDDGSNAHVSMLVPNADVPIEIEADRVRLGDVDATQYFGFAEVTDIVRAAGPGHYVVGNVQTVEVQGSYAGWSLVVVTNDVTMPRRQLIVTSPFAWFSPDDSYAATLPVPAATGQFAALDVLAFEGERGFVPELLNVGGIEIGGEGIFDSTITGERNPRFDNNFGIDIDAYSLTIDAPDGTLPIEATSGKDGIRLAVFGLAVDVE